MCFIKLWLNFEHKHFFSLKVAYISIRRITLNSVNRILFKKPLNLSSEIALMPLNGNYTIRLLKSVTDTLDLLYVDFTHILYVAFS